MKTYLILTALTFIMLSSSAQKETEYYQLKTYIYSTDAQEQMIDDFLKAAYLPALHRMGIKDIGVFKPIENADTLKSIFVLIPFSSFDQFLDMEGKLEKDKGFQKNGDLYINASPENIPYIRIESTIMKAFKAMPMHKTPAFKTAKKERVYELRSYQSPTEKLYVNKLHMFNVGDEVGIFTKLDFNAVFYGDVISGKNMPNLMYMTSFENMASRKAHWDSFGKSPEWNELKNRKEYLVKNVSNIQINLLYPAEYSDY